MDQVCRLSHPDDLAGTSGRNSRRAAAHSGCVPLNKTSPPHKPHQPLSCARVSVSATAKAFVSAVLFPFFFYFGAGNKALLPNAKWQLQNRPTTLEMPLPPPTTPPPPSVSSAFPPFPPLVAGKFHSPAFLPAPPHPSSSQNKEPDKRPEL